MFIWSCVHCRMRVQSNQDFHINDRLKCVQCNAEMEPWLEGMDVYEEKKNLDEDWCINVGCNEKATWIRYTQFSGNHYFCESCAHKEKDFGEEDSYKVWRKIEKSKLE